MNRSIPNIESIDVLILCGGDGTRFEPVSKGKPKALALINKEPLLDVVIEGLEQQGLKRFILAVGYQKEQIISHFKGSKKQIIFSPETTPLGTGGAIKAAKSKLNSNPFIVMNGDLLCNLDYSPLIINHCNSRLLMTMVVSKTSAPQDYGNIVLDKNNTIVSFTEKQTSVDSSYVSAGIYIMDNKIFSKFPNKKRFSIEEDFFQRNPSLINAHIIEESFIDIGTPERYNIAKQFNSANSDW